MFALGVRVDGNTGGAVRVFGEFAETLAAGEKLVKKGTYSWEFAECSEKLLGGEYLGWGGEGVCGECGVCGGV